MKAHETLSRDLDLAESRLAGLSPVVFECLADGIGRGKPPRTCVATWAVNNIEAGATGSTHGRSTRFG